MMRWPWTRRQTRATGGYSDAVVRAIQDRATGQTTAAPTATAALEASAGFVARAFASADVSGGALGRQLLNSHMLALAGRALIRHGEFVAYLHTIDGGRMALLPAASWDVDGGPDPVSWTYRITAAAPSGTTTFAAGSEAVAHVRIGCDPAEPWRGRSPVAVAALSGRLSSELAHTLGDEAAGPRGSLISIPTDGDSDTLAGLRDEIGKLAGKAALLSGGDWDTGATGGVAKWQPHRLGANPPQSLVQLHRQAFDEIIAACGLSSDLFTGAEGTGQREAYRRALHCTVAPMGKLLQDELRRVLEDDSISLDFQSLAAADIAGRARAFQSMVGAGMDLSEAADKSGLMMGED